MGDPTTTTRACPRCAAALVHVKRKGHIIEVCSGCRGLWLDPGELTVLVQLYKRLDGLDGAEAAGLECLGCRVPMRALTFPGTSVELARCAECESVWLDQGRLEALQQHVEHLVAEDGADHEEAVVILSDLQWAGQRRFACPRCGPETGLVHEKRGSNLVEACPSCDGLWFTTGELTLEVEVYRELEPETGETTALPCLVCDEALRELPFPGTDVRIDCCPQCRGVWLDRADLARIKAAFSDVVPQSASLQDRARELIDDLAPRPDGGECPICQGALQGHKRAGVLVDTCRDCGGTWFDSGELTIVLGVSRKIRLKEAAPTDLACVRCPAEKLVELTYPGTEVKIDVCPDCRGNWLDQGELDRLVEALGAERTG